MDDSQQPDLDFLKDLSFASGWAKEPPRPQTFESFSAPDEQREFVINQGGEFENPSKYKSGFAFSAASAILR